MHRVPPRIWTQPKGPSFLYPLCHKHLLVTHYPITIYLPVFRFDCVLWHINHCRLFNAKSRLQTIYSIYRIGLVQFYGISTLASYLMLNLSTSAVSSKSGSYNFDSFRDEWSVAVQLLPCGVLPPGLVQYCSQHSCVVPVKLFLHTFS